MRQIVLIAAVAAVAAGCQKGATHSAVRELSVTELAELTKTKAATPVDANSEGFRKTNGVIPGAIILSDYRKFDTSELGADKSRQLVFYCSSRT